MGRRAAGSPLYGALLPVYFLMHSERVIAWRGLFAIYSFISSRTLFCLCIDRYDAIGECTSRTLFASYFGGAVFAGVLGGDGDGGGRFA